MDYFSFCIIVVASIFQLFLLAPVSSADRDYNLPALPDLASITAALAALWPVPKHDMFELWRKGSDSENLLDYDDNSPETLP